jgi:hypothetical protein
MASEEKTAGGPTSAAETREWERRSTDPTVPFDGALPENIPGPASNVEAEIAAGKRADAYGELSTRLRPEHAKQRAKTGDSITDSDVNVAPSAGHEVGTDPGADERAKAEAEASKSDAGASKPDADAAKATPPANRQSAQQRQQKA